MTFRGHQTQTGSTVSRVRATPKRLMIWGLAFGIPGLILAFLLTAIEGNPGDAGTIVFAVFIWLGLIAGVLGILSFLGGVLAWIVKVGVRSAKD